MNKIQAGFAVAALAAFAAAPALAQTHVQSSQGATVMSSTGVMVTPGAPGVVVVPGTPGVVPQPHLLPGGTVTTVGSTTVSGAGPAPSSSTTTTVTRYWINVPAGAEADPQFQRWQRLK